MRFAEVLHISESIAGLVVSLAENRHRQLIQEQPDQVQTLPATAAEIVRLIEIRVQLLTGEGGPR